MSDENSFPMRSWEESATVAEVEVDREEFTLNKHELHKKEVDYIALRVPDTLEEARSAFCYDPVFNTAVEIFASKKNKRVETVLSENLMKMIQIRSELIAGEVRNNKDSVPSNVLHAFETESEISWSPEQIRSFMSEYEAEQFNPGMKQTVKDDEDTVKSLKSEYIEGEIDIYEFEDRVEEVLERE